MSWRKGWLAARKAEEAGHRRQRCQQQSTTGLAYGDAQGRRRGRGRAFAR